MIRMINGDGSLGTLFKYLALEFQLFSFTIIWLLLTPDRMVDGIEAIKHLTR